MTIHKPDASRLSRQRALEVLRIIRERLMQEMVQFICEHDEEMLDTSSDPAASNYRLQDLDGRMLATLNAILRAESLLAPQQISEAAPQMKTRVFITRVETEELLETKINALLAKLQPAEIVDVNIQQPGGQNAPFIACILYRKQEK